LEAGSLDDAIERAQRCADTASALGWSWWEAGQRDHLMRLLLRRAGVDDAERQGLAALRIARAHENHRRAATGLAGLAQVALARDDRIRAGLLWGAADEEWQRHPSRAEDDSFHGQLRTERDPALLAAYDRGRQLELWDAVLIALGESDIPQTVP
jgi:hypothetical protein